MASSGFEFARRTAPVARIGGFTDPDAMGRSYLREVWLG